MARCPRCAAELVGSERFCSSCGQPISSVSVVPTLAREAPARSDDASGTHAAGVVLRLARARVWVEGRGHPLRAGFGVGVAAIGVRVLTHPRLGDTVTLSLTLPPRGART